MSLENLDHHIFVYRRLAHRFDSNGYWDAGVFQSLSYDKHSELLEEALEELQFSFKTELNLQPWTQDSVRLGSITIPISDQAPTLVFSAFDRYYTILNEAELRSSQLALIKSKLADLKFEYFGYDDLQSLVPVHIEHADNLVEIQYIPDLIRSKTYYEAAFGMG